MLNLQDANGHDEVFAKLGTHKTPVLSVRAQPKRNNIGTEVFQGSIDLKVFEKDAEQRDPGRDRSTTSPAPTTPARSPISTAAVAVYRVVWSVA